MKNILNKLFYLTILILVLFTISCSEDEPGFSKKAYLTGLTISDGTISFDPGTFVYSIWGATNSSFDLTATASTDLSLSIAGNTITSGQLVTISNITKPTNVDILVTGDGFQSSTYTIAYYSYPPASDPRITNINLSQGSIDFSIEKTNYNISINASNTIGITVNTFQTNSVLTINDQAASTGVQSVITGLPNGVTNIPIQVVSKDEKNTNIVMINITYSWKPKFTSVNYSFDGGIAAVVGRLTNESSGGMSGNGTDVSLVETVTGVITSKNVLIASGYENCFFIQDSSAGLLFFASSDINADIGDQVSLTLVLGKTYYGMPEVTSYNTGSVTILSKENSIYYKTGNYDFHDAKGSFYQYTGSIADDDIGFYVGQFTGNLYFHWTSQIHDDLSTGSTGTHYGPISYSYDKYRMELNDENFIFQ